MIAATSTVAAYSLAAYLASADIVDATSIPTSRASTKVEEPHDQSFVGRGSWAGRAGYQGTTARSEGAEFIITADRPWADLITSVGEFLEFNAGWDGERAAAPKAVAVLDAVRFINAAGSLALGLEPTLHTDGSVILELDDGVAGSLRFRGDETIVYAFKGVAPGIVAFDGYSIPEQIGSVLRG